MPREIHPYAVLVRPLITEKGTTLTAQDKYLFEVDPRANKSQIKEAVELAFNVHVLRVNTMMMKGKPRRFGRRVTRRPDWKKAWVRLKAGEKVPEFLEGA